MEVQTLKDIINCKICGRRCLDIFPGHVCSKCFYQVRLNKLKGTYIPTKEYKDI